MSGWWQPLAKGRREANEGKKRNFSGLLFWDPDREATLLQSRHLALLCGPAEKRQSVCLALSGRLSEPAGL